MIKNFFYTFILLILASFISFAQIPDSFVNLKVLPSDISKDELINVMKSFTSGLGVRCNFCHVGEDGQPLSTFNFVSDEKDAKNKARIMMEMVHDINVDYLSKLSDFSKDIIQVKCVTCHRGAMEPKLLEDVLYGTVKKKGLTEAISTYHKLYDEYYGGFTYDFRDHSLLGLHYKLMEDSLVDEAIAFDSINVNLYPESGLAYLSLAEAYEKKGNKEKAIEYYLKTLELNPRGADFINKKIEALRSR